MKITVVLICPECGEEKEVKAFKLDQEIELLEDRTCEACEEEMELYDEVDEEEEYLRWLGI